MAEKTSSSTSATSNPISPLNPMLEAWRAAFGDIDDLNWETLANDLLPQLPPEFVQEVVKSADVSTFPPGPIVTKELAAEAPKTPQKKRAPKRKVTFSQSVIAPPLSRTRTISHAPPTPPPTFAPSSFSTPIPAPPAPASKAKKRSCLKKPDCPTLSAPCVSRLSTSPPTFPPALSVSESLVYLLDSYDTLVSPLIPPPANPSPACQILHRALYRKQFTISAQALLQSHKEPIISLDQLIPIFHAACGKCNVTLA